MGCVVCGSVIVPTKWDRKDKPRKVCSLRCRQSLNGSKGGMKPGTKGADHPKFKGGRIKNRDGYWRVPVGDHPFQRRNYYMFEHVKKMEAKIGRRLLPNECVHHKNGVITDNRLSNLRLMTKSAHSRMHRART